MLVHMNDTHEAPVVLVTGGSRGLGRGIAVRLAAEGCSVVVNYAGNREAAEETVKLCGEAAAQQTGQQTGRQPASQPHRQETQSQNFVALQGDIGRTEQREALVAEALREFGRIDGLVNNAGIAPKVRADITETGERSFDELMRTNLKGPFFLT